MSQYAVHRHCVEQGNLDRAGTKYHSSPMNIMNHLGTTIPGQKEAFEDVQRHKNGEGGGMVATLGGAKVASSSSVDAADPKQPLITKYFAPKTPEWKQKLVRWIVRTAQPLAMTVFNNLHSILYCWNTISEVKLHLKSVVRSRCIYAVCCLCALRCTCTESRIH